MRITKIAAVLLLAIAMFMLFGTGCKSAESAAAGGAASSVPSDGAIIAATKAQLTADDNEELAASKAKLQADLAKLQAEVAQCSEDGTGCALYSTAGVWESECRRRPGGSDVCGDFPGAGWYFNYHLGDRFNTQDDCLQAASKTCEPVDTSLIAEIDDDRSNISNFKFRANEYVITVEKANNYEGNIISYVDLRTKGTDTIGRYKVTMKLLNNTLSVVSMESSPQ